MSAASSKIEEKAHEPSMEEILASIRRIIADDQAPKPVEDAAPRPAPEPDDILDLAEIAEPVSRPKPAPEPAALDFDAIDFDAIDFDSLEVEPDPPAPPPAPEPPKMVPQPAARIPEPQPEPERLTSSATDSSVNQAFNLLASTVQTHNARSLEDLVKDMLRPMLKSWLDDNLPVVVERLVRAEIERVSRGH